MSKLYVISRANNGHYIVQRIRLNTSPDQDAMYIKLASSLNDQQIREKC